MQSNNAVLAYIWNGHCLQLFVKYGDWGSLSTFINVVPLFRKHADILYRAVRCINLMSYLTFYIEFYCLQHSLWLSISDLASKSKVIRQATTNQIEEFKLRHQVTKSPNRYNNHVSNENCIKYVAEFYYAFTLVYHELVLIDY